MSTHPVRYAIISPAGWGRRYLDALAGSPKMELAAVWGRSADNVARVVEKYGGNACASFDAVLADPGIEAVLLPTPHFLHYFQAKAALLAGKHVFVEKPLANRLDEAEELKTLSEARRLVLAVGLQGRRTAGIRKVKNLLATADYGRPALVTVVHGSPQVQLTYKPGDWETSDITLPGGILDQLGVHYAEVLQYLFGPVRRVSGFCNRDISPYPTIDSAAGAYEFASGLVAVHATHQVSPYVSELRIFTDRGVLQVNRMGRELIWEPIADLATAKAGASTRRTIPLEGPEMTTTAIKEELEEFADCIRHGTRPEVGAPEAIAALRLVRAIMRAHATGQAVDPAMLTD
jgi:predicted dehydrogenase